MFKVKDKYDNEIYTVFSIREHKDKEIQFLIYWRETWRWVFANNYEPIEEEVK